MGKKLAWFFVALFIVADAYFIGQYTRGMGFILIEAIALSIIVAAVLDCASYFASSFGLAALLEIPSIDIPEIKKDKMRSIIILAAVGLIVISAQIFLGLYRSNQISEKKLAYSVEKSEYDKSILAIDNDDSRSAMDKEREKRILLRPAYDGNEIIDYISIIVPIVTTILSFALGLIGGRKYNRFEKERERLQQKKDGIKKQYDELQTNYEANIGIILRASKNKKLDENITSKQLSEEKNEILNMIEDNFQKGVPESYRSNINTLLNEFEKQAEDIKQNLSKGAEDETLILTFPYKDQEELKEEIAKLGELNERIINI